MPLSSHNLDKALLIELVKAAQTGDRISFDKLADIYRPVLTGIAFFRTGEMSEAEDLVQTALTKAWTNIHSINEPAQVTAWMKAIIANCCRDWQRRSRSRLDSLDNYPHTIADASIPPLDVIIKREEEDALREALYCIPNDNRIALIMHIFGDYSYEDIAEFTETHVSTVEGRIYRAKQQLRKLLKSSDLLSDKI